MKHHLQFDDGNSYFRSDSQIANITKSEIVEKVNNWGYSELFLTGLCTQGDKDCLIGLKKIYCPILKVFLHIYYAFLTEDVNIFWCVVFVSKYNLIRTVSYFNITITR